jgi:hypothetical protein
LEIPLDDSENSKMLRVGKAIIGPAFSWIMLMVCGHRNISNQKINLKMNACQQRYVARLVLFVLLLRQARLQRRIAGAAFGWRFVCGGVLPFDGQRQIASIELSFGFQFIKTGGFATEIFAVK